MPIAGFEGLYEVSSLGRVKSLAREVLHSHGNLQTCKERVLKPFINKGGYGTVGLHKNGSQLHKKVHALVAEAFIGPRPEGLQVRHGTRGKLDNSLANLCYGTPKQNSADKVRDGTHNRGERNPKAKLTEADIREIRSLLAAGKRQKSIANTFGVANSTICFIKQGKIWAHVA